MKPIDKAIYRMVSKSPGCNASEPKVASKNFNFGGRALGMGAKAACLSAT